MPTDYSATIYTKVYDLLAWLIPLLAKFPKEQRFVLAQHLLDDATELHELLIRARRIKSPDARRDVLAQADGKLEQLRLYCSPNGRRWERDILCHIPNTRIAQRDERSIQRSL